MTTRTTSLTRRKLIITASASLMIVPVALLCGKACAATNATLREKLKYLNHPKESKSCSSCLEFVPSTSNPDIGQCKVIPGDDEISVNGYCDAWNTM